MSVLVVVLVCRVSIGLVIIRDLKLVRVNSRSKGKRGELEVAKLFRRFYGDSGAAVAFAKLNGLKYNQVRRSFGQARDGFEQPDIIGGGLEKDYFVEVKRYKKVTVGALKKWREKMMEDYIKYEHLLDADDYNACPVLIYRADGERSWSVHLIKEDARKLGLEDNHAILHSELWLSYNWDYFADAVERKLNLK